MSTDFVKDIETKELIDKLVQHGYGEIVNAFLLNESKTYTKKSRLNKSGACRVLDYKPKQLDDKFKMMRELLKSDFDEE